MADYVIPQIPPSGQASRSPKNPRLQEQKRAWTARNIEKRQAHKRVENAIIKGELVRLPCERCGAVNAQAHHEDYSKPLEVMWLCDQHHKDRHVEIKHALNPSVVRPKTVSARKREYRRGYMVIYRKRMAALREKARQCE